MVQVLSVSYWAGFGHGNKVGLVTAKSPGTAVSPQNLGGSGTQVWGHHRSLTAELTGTSPMEEPRESKSGSSSQSGGIL